MYSRNVIKLCWVVLSLVVALAKASETTEDAICNSKAIPEILSSQLESAFKEWRIKNLRDFYDSYDRELWTKAKPGICPGIASGHFINSQSKDYALLLLSEDPKIKSYKIVVFSIKGEKASHFTVVEKNDDFFEKVVISRVPPGKYAQPGGDIYPGPQTVQIKMDGILSEYLEASGEVYYWSKGRFRSIVVSE